MKKFIIVSYDITSDRKRRKVSQILEGYGTRIQYSVFECKLDAKELKEMAKKVTKHINKKEDSIRCYPLCNNCFAKTIVMGKGDPPQFTNDPWIF